MRKSSILMPVLAFIAGLIGCFLRHTELATVFDPSTGLASANEPVTLALIALSVVVFVACLIFAIAACITHYAAAEYERAFNSSGMLYLIIFFVLGIAMAAAAYLSLNYLKVSGAVSPVVFYGFPVLGLASGISMIVLALGAYRGSANKAMPVLSVITPAFLCVLLIVVYKDHVADPVLLRYAYACLAVVAAALSFYYSAGFVFKKSVTGKTILAQLLTIYLCTVVIADAQPLYMTILFGILALSQLANSIVFIRNLHSKKEEAAE